MKLLTLDLETSPNVAHVWGLWKQNVSLNQLMSSGSVISFAAKWHDEKKVMFWSDYHDSHQEMVKAAHDLLSDADAVIHYNGTSFDMPLLRQEFLLSGMTPPEPFKDIDLLRVVRNRFRFVSNKLQYVSTALGLEGKTHHEGHTLWVKCMNNDDAAWSTMRKYNKQDVVVTEKLYDILTPWIPNAPSAVLREEGALVRPTCGRCGSGELTKQGFAYTQLSVFQQWKCLGCGSWSRSAKRLKGLDVRTTE